MYLYKAFGEVLSNLFGPPGFCVHGSFPCCHVVITKKGSEDLRLCSRSYRTGADLSGGSGEIHTQASCALCRQERSHAARAFPQHWNASIRVCRVSAQGSPSETLSERFLLGLLKASDHHNHQNCRLSEEEQVLSDPGGQNNCIPSGNFSFPDSSPGPALQASER